MGGKAKKWLGGDKKWLAGGGEFRRGAIVKGGRETLVFRVVVA